MPRTVQIHRRMAVQANGRAVLWLGFYLLILLAWVAAVRMAAAIPGAEVGSLPAEFWAALCLSAGAANPLALWAMWAVMAAAMMLPGFVPTLSTFIDLSGAGASNGRSAAALVAGYLAVWLGASALGAGAQWALSRAGFVTLGGASLSPWLTVLLLVGAGLYQFSSLKDACLSKCRLPISFFIERWRPGKAAALRMGAELGGHCLGCCWALMALGFVGGTMNLIWMGAATVFMALEKLPAIGGAITRPMGFLLIGAAAAMTFRALGFF